MKETTEALGDKHREKERGRRKELKE